MTCHRFTDQRFMVSPCGKHADWVALGDIATKAPGWSDCTELSDTELQQFMMRRMQAAWARA